MGTISIAPPPSTAPTPDLEMDIEQVAEVMSDQGWGEEETILVDPARHIDIEEVEGNDSSSDSNDEECSTEEQMTHPHENTVAEIRLHKRPHPLSRNKHQDQEDGIQGKGGANKALEWVE